STTGSRGSSPRPGRRAPRSKRRRPARRRRSSPSPGRGSTRRGASPAPWRWRAYRSRGGQQPGQVLGVLDAIVAVAVVHHGVDLAALPGEVPDPLDPLRELLGTVEIAEAFRGTHSRPGPRLDA